MSEEFSIQTFIESRWAEAKKELESLDTQFVISVPPYDSILQRGIGPGTNLITPTKRLAFSWHELLESTFDVMQTINRIEITLDLMGKTTDLKFARYYHEMWLENAYALCQKIESLISYTCKVYSINKKSKRRYHQSLKADVQELIERNRTALSHGANRPRNGAEPIVATAITDDGLWEAAVVYGTRSIKDALEQINKGGGLTDRDYYRMTDIMNREMLSRIGSIMEQVDQEIRR